MHVFGTQNNCTHLGHITFPSIPNDRVFQFCVKPSISSNSTKITLELENRSFWKAD
jgi:hypothetical protein